MDRKLTDNPLLANPEEELVRRIFLIVDEEKDNHDWIKDFDFIYERVQSRCKPLVEELIAIMKGVEN